MPARKIDFYFTVANPLRAIAAEVRHLTDLQQAFLKAAPPALAQSSRVGAVRGDILFLSADNAAVATKLKQLAPRLLTSFRKQGFKATSIQIRVQVNKPWTPGAPAPKSKRLSSEVIESLEKLSGELDDSPLKKALSEMVARQRQKS